METPFSAGHAAPLPASLWAATTPRLQSFPQLAKTIDADVAVIGAGFMGLSAARALAANGARVAVVEAALVGWGASGRNHGLLVPGLKRDPHEVRRILGDDRGERLLRFSGHAVDLVVELIREHGIECDLRRRGWIQPAHARAALKVLERRAQDWQQLGARTAMIPADELPARLGTRYYVGAMFDPRGGCLNPLALVRGYAGAAARAGARIYEQSPATGITREGRRWRVESNAGTVRCEQVLCCTNAYNDSIERMRAVVLPLRTAQVASAPLTAGQAARILPGGEATSDTQRLLTSFRLTNDRRLIMGGASATAGDEHPGLFATLHASAIDRFPFLQAIDWEFGWSGYLALSSNHLPRVFHAGDGFWAAMACNGRGIAMATAVGEAMARQLITPAADDCPLPIEKPRRMIAHALRRPGVAAGVLLKRVLDVAEWRRSGGSSRS